MVFDASALLAIIGDEPDRAAASAHLSGGSVVSTVNAGEVIGKLVKRGMNAAEATEALRDLELTWVAPDDRQAQRVGELGAIKNLSLADRFCTALGEARAEPLVTGDRDWAKINIKTVVEFFR